MWRSREDRDPPDATWSSRSPPGKSATPAAASEARNVAPAPMCDKGDACRGVYPGPCSDRARSLRVATDGDARRLDASRLPRGPHSAAGAVASRRPSREAHLPAQQSQAQEDPRFPPPDAHHGGSRRAPCPPGARPQASLGLIWRVRDRATFEALARARPRRAGPIWLRSCRTDGSDRPARGGLRRRPAVGTAVERNRIRRRLRAAVPAARRRAPSRGAPISSAPTDRVLHDRRSRPSRGCVSPAAAARRYDVTDAVARRPAPGRQPASLAAPDAPDPGLAPLSVHLPPRCRFHPSCSQYALDALDCTAPAGAAGWPCGGWVAATPGTTGGLDPVPPTPNVRSHRATRRRGGRRLIPRVGSSTRSTTSSGRSSRSSTGWSRTSGSRSSCSRSSVMLVLFPLTAKQAKAMLHMQRAQPEIKKHPGEVQERPRQAERRGDEVLPGEQDQPARGLSAAPGPDADLPRAVQRDAQPLQVHSRRLRPVRRVLHRNAAGEGCQRRLHVRSRPAEAPRVPRAWTCRSSAIGVTGGFLDALPYFILVGLVIVTGFLQARQSRRNAPNMN